MTQIKKDKIGIYFLITGLAGPMFACLPIMASKRSIDLLVGAAFVTTLILVATAYVLIAPKSTVLTDGFELEANCELIGAIGLALAYFFFPNVYFFCLGAIMFFGGLYVFFKSELYETKPKIDVISAKNNLSNS